MGRKEQALIGSRLSDLFEAPEHLEPKDHTASTPQCLTVRRTNGSGPIELFCDVTPLEGSSPSTLLRLRAPPRPRTAPEQGSWQSVVLTKVQDAVLVADGELGILFMNPAAEALSGWTLEEALRAPIGQVLQFIDESTRQPRTPALMAALRGDTTLQTAFRLLVARDGRELPVEQHVLRLNPVDGAVAAIVLRPLSERRRLEQELLRSTQEIAERDRLNTEFLAMLGHELRNPLSATTHALEVLRLGSPDHGLLERAQATAERQVQNMARLVDGLLDVSRVTRGAITLRREQVNAREVLESALDQTQPEMLARGIQLSVVAPEEALALEADRARLEQIMGNLLNNAARYTEPSGHVWVRLSREKNQIVLRVADDGVGISPELLPRVFEPFTQEIRSLDRAGEGLGVGLTLVRSLVEMHGGSVSAHSEGLSRGSEFTVRLPALETHIGSPSGSM